MLCFVNFVNALVCFVYSTRRGSKGIRFDKKYLVFGDRTPDGTHFLANIQRILQYTLEGMLVVSDVSISLW